MMKAASAWPVRSLQDVATVQTGLAKGKPALDGSLTVPYLRVRNVQDGFVDLSEVRSVDVTPKQIDRYGLRFGDVLFTEGGDFDKLGRGAVWRGQMVPCIHQNHVFVVRPHTDALLPEFLAAVAASAHGRRYFQLSSKQSTNLASINSSQLKAFQIPIPPLPEQRKIAGILRTWDDAIEGVESTLRQSIQRRTGLVQTLIFGHGWPHGVIWHQTAPSWDIRPIEKVASEVSSRNNGLWASDVLTCSKYRGFVRSADYFTRTVHSADLSNYKIVRRGQFGFPSNHVEEGSIGLQNVVDVGAVSPIYTVFEFNRSLIDDDFAYLVLKMRAYTHMFSVSTSSSVDRRDSLRWPEFSKLPFPVPPLDEQRRISGIASDADREIELLQRKAELLRTQKRGLMQKLLTGQVRVNAVAEDEPGGLSDE